MKNRKKKRDKRNPNIMDGQTDKVSYRADISGHKKVIIHKIIQYLYIQI